MANFKLLSSQKVPYTVTANDGNGNAAALKAGDTLVIVSSDTTLATVVPDATPTAGFIASGFIVPVGPAGTVQITASALNADGSVDIKATDPFIDISLPLPVATALTLDLGVAQAK
jgi:hypothetical protein